MTSLPVKLEQPLSGIQAMRVLDSDLHHNLAFESVMTGRAPGTIWADNAEQPAAVFVLTQEGCGLMGDTGLVEFVEQIPNLITDVLFPDPEIDMLDIRIGPYWDTALLLIATVIDRPVIEWPRRYYTCTALMIPDWRERVEPPFAVRPIDAALLDDSSLAVPDHIYSWTAGNWGGRDAYLAKGFGTCVVDQEARRVVAWCIADCATGDRCEIGIHTAEVYRRRGLATIAAAAAVDYALSSGYRHVGWHCNEENHGSRGVAEAVGFTHQGNYTSYFFLADKADHDRLAAYRQQLDKQT